MNQITDIKSQTELRSALERLVKEINFKEGIVAVSVTCADYTTQAIADLQWGRYKGRLYRDVYIFSNGLLWEAHYKRENSILGFYICSRGKSSITSNKGREERAKIEEALGLKVENRPSGANEAPRVLVDGIPLVCISMRGRHIKEYYGSTKIYMGRK